MLSARLAERAELEAQLFAVRRNEESAFYTNWKPKADPSPYPRLRMTKVNREILKLPLDFESVFN